MKPRSLQIAESILDALAHQKMGRETHMYMIQRIIRELVLRPYTPEELEIERAAVAEELLKPGCMLCRGTGRVDKIDSITGDMMVVTCRCTVR